MIIRLIVGLNTAMSAAFKGRSVGGIVHKFITGGIDTGI